jgi:hypothetical protein
LEEEIMENKTCPNCGGEVVWDDYYGRRIDWNRLLDAPFIEKTGDIYRCQNEDCGLYWHTVGDSDWIEGYPC